MPAPDKSASRRGFVKTAAGLAGISAETLWGVYGTESGFGANLGPSSAGALGPFQFMPATAKSVGLDDPMDFQASCLASAKYLHDLGADRTADSAATTEALNRYNGNGGGRTLTDYVQNVRRNGKTLSDGSPADTVSDAVGGVTDAVTAPLDAADAVGKALGDGIGFLTDPSSWLRVGKGLLGYVFVIMGVGGIVLIVAKPVAQAAVGVTGTGKAVQKAVKTIATPPKS